VEGECGRSEDCRQGLEGALGLDWGTADADGQGERMQMWEAGFEKQARGQLEGVESWTFGPRRESDRQTHHTAGTRRFYSSGVMIVWLCPPVL
jgi:hypothetical protein